MRIGVMEYNLPGGVHNVVKSVVDILSKDKTLDIEFVYPKFKKYNKELQRKKEFMFELDPPDCDVLFLHDFSWKSALVDIPKISVYHGSSYISLRANYPKNISRLTKLSFSSLLSWFRMKTSDVNIAVDSFTQSKFEGMRFVPNGVDIDKFSPKHSNMFSTKKKKALFVGTPILRKGVFDLDRIERELGDDFELIKSYELKDRVSDEDLPKLYNSCDVFILPSHYEGMPMTILEAMACGKPIVTYDLYGMRDCVWHDVNGYLVKENDYHGFAKSVEKAYNNRKIFGVNSRILSEKIFNSKRMAYQYLEYFKESLK